MAGQLSQKDIAGSLFSHWADQFPLSVTTIYPGTRIETVSLTEWLELWIETWSRRAQRTTNKQVLDLTVSVHCFVKQGLDKSRIYELADAVRQTIAQKTVPIRDTSLSGTPVTGYLTLTEPETHELTRNNIGSLQHAMQHLVITCRGIAQEI